MSISGVTPAAADEESRKVLQEMIRETDGYVKALGTVASAAELAHVMNIYADALEPLKPGMDKIKQKYPDLKTNPPEELKPLVAQFGQLMGQMMAASMKHTQYAQDPAVMKATQRVQALLGMGRRGRGPGKTKMQAPPPPPPPPSTPARKKVAVMARGGSDKLDILVLYTREAFSQTMGEKHELLDGPGENADLHLVIESNNLGTNTLTHYGSSTTQYTISLRMKLVDPRNGRLITGPVSETVNFTALNEEDNLKEAVQTVVDKLK